MIIPMTTPLSAMVIVTAIMTTRRIKIVPIRTIVINNIRTHLHQTHPLNSLTNSHEDTATRQSL